jgi:predicted phosphodiesterase
MAAKKHSPAFLKKRMAEIRKAGDMSAASRALGVPRATLQNQVMAAVAMGIPDPFEGKPPSVGGRPPSLPPDPVERRVILDLREKVGLLEKALADADRKALDADRFRALTAELHDSPVPTPDWAVRVPSGDDSPGVPVLMLGDWHIGETVDPAQMHGANTFNEEVADRRVRQLVDRALWLAFHHVKTPTKYPGIVVVLGGDFVSGWLHEELFATDWCPPTVAANWCVSRLRRVLLRLADAFGRVHVVAVPGNHGRLTRKPMAKGGAQACFDHAIYGALADFLAEDKRFTWDIPAAGDTIVQIAGTKYLVMHGHELGVKGGDGIIGSLGPIMRGAIKTGRAERSLHRDFDVLMLFHFHQEIWQPRSGIIVSGTLKGYDEWARKQRYAFAPPTQWLFFSHPRFGPNLPFDIRLEEPPLREPVRFVAVAEA